MPKTSLLAALITGLATPVLAAGPDIAADEVVAAIEGVFGSTPGQRRNHIKGTCAVGEFVGTPAAAAYSRSPLFAGKPVPVVARLSLAGGNAKAPDTAKSPRGMALEFRLPGGALHHITMINTPMFGAAHPRTFLAQMQAIRPDPATGKPDPEKIKAFKAAHPDNKAQADYLAANNPPASYATSSYWGLHTFKFVDAANRTTLVRWRFAPTDGERRLSDEEMKTAPANFLEAELIERLRRGPAKWDMQVSIGEPGDAENDPTVLWPEGRRQIVAGTLTLTAAMPQAGAECAPINFDPLIMADGIAPTDDPVLLFRSPAYAVSFAKRASGQ